mgnify:FL=1
MLWRNRLMLCFASRECAGGLVSQTKQLRDVWGSKMPAVEIYRDHVLPFYPPVFHKWFLKSFPDPTTWFEARLAYARAIAVMSMVGYLVGFVAALPLHG